MKLNVKYIAIVGMLTMSAGTIGGTTWNHEVEEIYASGGDGGGWYIRAYEYCRETRESFYGYTRIYGYIAGVRVNESKYYTDACPNISKFNFNNNEVSNEVILNGIVVTSNCTGQVVSKGSGKSQYKVPGQKPENNTDQYKRHYTPWSAATDGSCVITATNAAGDTETYGSYTSVYGSQDRSHTNAKDVW